MKILYTITKSEAGGAQIHVCQLAAYFAREGHEVAVMAYPGGPPLLKLRRVKWLREEVEKIGIKFYPNRYFKNSYNPFFGLKAMKEVKGVVEDFGPDVVHCHSTVASFWTRLALGQGHSAELSRSPQGKPRVIFTAHGWAFTEGASFSRRILFPFVERLAAKFCDKIICVSEYDKELALKYKIVRSASSGQVPEEKLVTIHNGVEITNHKPQIANKLQIPSSKLQIVFVGRLDKQKDPELLLEAFSELPDETREKAEVLIIGDGPKLEKLQIINNKLQINNVRFLGGLPRERVFEILRESDIFVLISNYEGFPMTILEAMSCGLPVIASNVGGVSEALRQAQGKQVGFLIKKRDKDDLKKALTELIENPGLREKMGRAARERVGKEFSLDKMLKETEKVYNEII